MKTLLKIDLRDDGVSAVSCDVVTDLEGKRLAAAMIVLAHSDDRFLQAMMSAAITIAEHPAESKRLSDLSKLSAAAKGSGNKPAN